MTRPSCARALACALSVLAAGIMIPSPSPAVASRLDRARLDARIGALARDARPARLGVAVLVPASGERWSFAGAERFPMQSVFKAPLAAMVLDAADRGRLRLDSTLVLRERDLSLGYSSVADSFPARTRYTVAELLARAVGESDNTAADLLLGLVHGPRALTAWLEAHRIAGIHVDRTEREQQLEVTGVGSAGGAWLSDSAFTRARALVPASAQRAAGERYLAGKLDMITPDGAVTFLVALRAGRLLSPRSTERLLRIMTETPTGARRLKAGLPPGAALAHKTGTGQTILGVCTASNDIGLVTLPDGRSFAIAVLLSGSTTGEAARDSVHAAVARAVVEAIR